MRLAVTSLGPELNSQVDVRFGRAQCFLLFDTETGQASVVNNHVNLNAAQGAGIQSARRLAELSVQAAVTGHVGPKAFATLQAAGVQVFTGAAGTVAEAIKQFKAGAMKQAIASDVEGHWA